MYYLAVILILLVLSFIYDINGKLQRRDSWYNVMLVIFILIAGLRWRIGVDTPNYLGFFYHVYPTIDKFSFKDYGLFSSPLFALLNSLVKTLGGRFYVIQLIHATFINILIFRYIKKHTAYIFTCLFFYSFICYTTYNMETMRASISIVICLYANDYIIDKKWWKGYMLYALALLFHAQTIVMFVLPLLFFLRLNKWGFMVLLMSFLVGFILSDLLRDYLFLLEGEEELEDSVAKYASSAKYGTGGGLFHLLAFFVLPTIYLLGTFYYLKNKKSCPNVNRMEPFILTGLVFIMIRTNFEIAYRYVDCFKIYFVILYSEFFVILIKDSRKIDKLLSYVRSTAILFPIIFFHLIYTYIISDSMWYRYYPYNSIFERNINREQQLEYNRVRFAKFPRINREEY